MAGTSLALKLGANRSLRKPFPTVHHSLLPTPAGNDPIARIRMHDRWHLCLRHTRLRLSGTARKFQTLPEHRSRAFARGNLRATSARGAGLRLGLLVGSSDRPTTVWR